MSDVLIGAVIGSAASLAAALITLFFVSRRERKQARLYQLSLALSALFQSYTLHFEDSSDKTYASLLANTERVYLFCSKKSLPVVNAFRDALLSHRFSPDSLGAQYRELADHFRKEIHR